jgi:hypothetical protein
VNIPGGSGSYTRTTITATAGQTSFSAVYTVNYVEVFLNGILLNSADYTATTGTTVVLATAAAANDIVDVVALNISSFTGGVTITGTPTNGQLAAWTGSTSLQGINGYPTWQAVQTGNFTAVAGNAYPVNTTSGAVTVTLPASPSAGDIVLITDYAGTFATNNCTINPNGGKLAGLTSNSVLNVTRESVSLVYIDSTQGWIAYSVVLANPLAITANYLVVAGGAGGGGFGGGGAGGYQASTLTLTRGTVYTVTVGSGGAAGTGSTQGTNGNNSVFGSVTSTGGGGGGGVSNTLQNGLSGGSGGGAGIASTNPFGTGAVGSGTSGQGNNGGLAGTGGTSAGGGGGAGAVGSAGVTTAGGAGGVGTASSITGASVTYAGGGGGAGSVTRGSGGTGGGGAGAQQTGSLAGVAGTANTGGGGGGAYSTSFAAGAGGSGIVIISLPTANWTGTTTGSPTITTSGSNTIMTFTTSGSYTA